MPNKFVLKNFLNIKSGEFWYEYRIKVFLSPFRVNLVTSTINKKSIDIKLLNDLEIFQAEEENNKINNFFFFFFFFFFKDQL